MANVRQDALESTLHKIAKKRNYEEYKLDISPTSTGGANYTSCLFRGQISAPNQPGLKFFAKVAAMNDAYRSKMPSQIFFIEQYAYLKIANMFVKIQNKHSVAEEFRLPMPVLYGYAEAAPQEVLVLEDLGASGFDIYDRRESMTWPIATTAVTQLARLHALTIALQHDYPSDFQEVLEALKSKNAESLQVTILETVNRTIDLVKEKNRERVRTFVLESFPQALKSYYEMPKRPVLAHGDFRMSNIMYKPLEDGKYEMVIIDYQTLHVSSALKDLMFFIFTGSDAEFRKHYYTQLLDHYYQQLTLALSRLHLDSEKIYPREEFDNELKENLYLGLLFATLNLPAMLVDAELAPIPGQTQMESALEISGSALCSARLNEVVEDYLRWGVL